MKLTIGMYGKEPNHSLAISAEFSDDATREEVIEHFDSLLMAVFGKLSVEEKGTA